MSANVMSRMPSLREARFNANRRGLTEHGAIALYIRRFSRTTVVSYDTLNDVGVSGKGRISKTWWNHFRLPWLSTWIYRNVRPPSVDINPEVSDSGLLQFRPSPDRIHNTTS